MKTTIRKIMAAIMASTAMIPALAGCESEALPKVSGETASVTETAAPVFKTNEPLNLTIVLGKTRYAPDPDLTLIAVIADQLAEFGGNLTVVVDDGRPEENFNSAPIDPPDKSKTEAAKKKLKNQNLKSIAAAVSGMSAKAEGTNTLKALQVAADNTPKNGLQSKLVIFDSGIQTEGSFRMESLSVVNSQRDEIIRQLGENMEIPALDCFSDIVWYGMGKTTGDQEQPANIDVIGLKSYYLSVIKATGYQVTNADALFSTVDYKSGASDHSGYPNVRTVAITDVSVKPPEITETDTETEVEAEIPDDTDICFDESDFMFEKNTAQLVNEKQAEENAKSIAEYINSYTGDLILVGTTAKWGSEDTSLSLSKQRAEAISKILVKQGVDKSRIKCYGAGFSDPDLYYEDLDSNGNLIESAAAANRRVHLLSANHEFARKYVEETFNP